MKKTKKYVKPEVRTLNIDTAPLLAGSDVKGSGEGTNFMGDVSDED